MNNLLLVGVVVIVIGGVAGGIIANNYLSEQNQDDGLNFNSSAGFGKDGFNNDKNGDKNQNKLKVNNKITVINIALIDIWNQYIEIINVEVNNINFNISPEESVQVGGHVFNIPNGTMVSTGYANSNGNFYSSDIYQTSEGCSFGIMVITNPNGTAEELATQLANEKNIAVSKDTLKKIDSSGNIDVYKFEYEGITHYIYNDGNDIVIIVMNQTNDNLFMYMTNSSPDGTIDESNSYYQNTESADNSLNDSEYPNEEDNNYPDSSYEENPYEDTNYDESYYNEGDNNGEYY